MTICDICSTEMVYQTVYPNWVDDLSGVHDICGTCMTEIAEAVENHKLSVRTYRNNFAVAMKQRCEKKFQCDNCGCLHSYKGVK